MHEDIHDTFVDKVTEKMKSLTVGDPLDDKTDFGAIINETQLNSIDEKYKKQCKMALNLY